MLQRDPRLPASEVSRFGLAVSGRTSVRIRFGSPFSSKVVVGGHKLQALVYDILPSNTAVFSYAIRVQKTVS